MLVEQALSFRDRVSAAVMRASTAFNFQERVSVFVAEAKRLAADGLTYEEASQLFTALIVLAVESAKALVNTGAEKKQFVLEAVAFLFDAIAPAIPLPWFLIWLQPFRPMFRPALRAFVLSLADGVIEAVYARLKE